MVNTSATIFWAGGHCQISPEDLNISSHGRNLWCKNLRSIATLKGLNYIICSTLSGLVLGLFAVPPIASVANHIEPFGFYWNLYLRYMFKDKKLRNTFWLAVFAVASPLWLLSVLAEDNVSGYFTGKAFIGAIFGFIGGIKALGDLYTNWEIWDHFFVKILILIMGLLSILEIAYPLYWIWLQQK